MVATTHGVEVHARMHHALEALGGQVVVQEVHAGRGFDSAGRMRWRFSWGPEMLSTSQPTSRRTKGDE